MAPAEQSIVVAVALVDMTAVGGGESVVAGPADVVAVVDMWPVEEDQFAVDAVDIYPVEDPYE